MSKPESKALHNNGKKFIPRKVSTQVEKQAETKAVAETPTPVAPKKETVHTP